MQINVLINIKPHIQTKDSYFSLTKLTDSLIPLFVKTFWILPFMLGFCSLAWVFSDMNLRYIDLRYIFSCVCEGSKHMDIQEK